MLPLRERGSAAPAAAKSVYDAVWECDMPLTKPGVRGELAIDVAVQDFGCITIPLTACKVYADADTSAAHGELLQVSGAPGALSLACCPPPILPTHVCALSPQGSRSVACAHTCCCIIIGVQACRCAPSTFRTGAAG